MHKFVLMMCIWRDSVDLAWHGQIPGDANLRCHLGYPIGVDISPSQSLNWISSTILDKLVHQRSQFKVVLTKIIHIISNFFVIATTDKEITWSIGAFIKVHISWHYMCVCVWVELTPNLEDYMATKIFNILIYHHSFHKSPTSPCSHTQTCDIHPLRALARIPYMPLYLTHVDGITQLWYLACVQGLQELVLTLVTT